jgi:hypothetical protein
MLIPARAMHSRHRSASSFALNRTRNSLLVSTLSKGKHGVTKPRAFRPRYNQVAGTLQCMLALTICTTGLLTCANRSMLSYKEGSGRKGLTTS